ncbi:MAG: hypothetical protein DRI24_22175 [Deltaproteobacteria bacterium]|nr:MAG: hypothetical protein DRI24_22175 [Deltaproteobacteria bacterium]
MSDNSRGSKYQMSSMEEFLVDPINHSELGEVFDASVGEVVDEGMTISSIVNPLPLEKRSSSIRTLIGNGDLPADYIDTFGMKYNAYGQIYDWDSMANDINDNYDFDEHIPTNIDMELERNEMLAGRKRYRDDVFARGGNWSGTTRFAGNMVGGGLDPVNMAAMLIPPLYGARQVSRAMYTLSKFKQGAVIGAASAVAIEPFVYDWKQEIGSEYTAEEALFNIAASTILNGAVDGIAGNLGHLYSTKNPDDFTKMKDIYMERGLDEEDAESMAYFVYEVAHAPDQKMSAVDFMTRIEQTDDAIATGYDTDRELGFDINDTEAVDTNYEALPEDLYYNDEDGQRVLFKDLDNQLDLDQERYSEMLECLNG